jgi:hypothetical protein
MPKPEEFGEVQNKNQPDGWDIYWVYHEKW